MKILAGILALPPSSPPPLSRRAAPPPPRRRPAPTKASRPLRARHTDDVAAAPKPAGTATPEPEQAPEGTTPVKPADTPSR